MAQLKDTIVSGNLRVTDTTLTDTLQVTIIKAPTSSNETTYGPGTSGQVLKSNGTSVYWTSDSTVSPATVAPQNVSTTAVIGTSTLYARQDHVHAIALATGDNHGQVKIANSNVSVKGLKSAAYTESSAYLSSTTNYAGSSSVGGAATSANKLNTNAGATNRPVYFSGGVPVQCDTPWTSSWFKGVPLITTEGVMEIGKYIDFHKSNDSTADYDLRLQYTGTATGKTITLPGASGNVALLAKGGTSHYGMMDGDGTTSGWIRTTTNGFIPATSVSLTNGGDGSLGTSLWAFKNAYIANINGVAVGSSPKFTDENVLQSDTSSTSDFRPILLGTTHTTTVADLSATITGQAYVSSNIFVKPNTGIICAEEFSTLSYINGTGAHLEQYGLYLKSYKAAALPAGGNYSYKGYVVRTYDGKSANNGGMLLTMDGGGLTIVGSGSASSLADLISDDQQDSNASRTRLNIGGTLNTAYHGSSEYLILSSNKSIVFLTNCSTIADRKPVVLDTSLRFYPGTTNTGSIGISSYQWNTIYGKTIYENGTSLASKYAAIGHTHNYAGSSSAGGAATSATAWTTARTLTLGGQLTGSVSVKGDADMTLNGYLKNSVICDGSEDFASYAWHKFAETTISDGNSDRTITFIVSKTWDNPQNCGGILTAHIRTNETKVHDSSEFYWQLANADINPADFVLVYTNTANTSCKVELWYKQNSRWDGWIFVVLKEHRRKTNGDDWTLYSSIDGHGSATHTAGTDSYPSTLAGIKTLNIAKNPSTATTYAISFGGAGESGVEAPTNGTFTTGAKDHYVNDGLGYRTREGVAGGTEGLSALVLGNSLASSVANNKTGYVRQYSTNKYYTDLKPNTLTASRTILLPDAAGTIAVFPAARTSGQVVVTDGTAGAVKSSGYTIATSVPSGAVFTDTKVTQTAVGLTYTNYRPIVISGANSATEGFSPSTTTDGTFITSSLYCQPSTGMLHANIFKAGKASTTDGEIKFYNSGSSGETTLKAKAQSTSGTYLLPACGNGIYTLSIGMMQVGGTGDSLVMSNVSGIPSGTLSYKIIFKSNATSPIYSMVEIPNMGDGVDCGGLIQVGDYTDGQGSTRIIMKSVIIRVTAGSTTGTKTFTATVSPTQKISGSSVSEFTRNVIMYKIYACC